MSEAFKTLWQFRYMVSMAHPNGELGLRPVTQKPIKEPIRLIDSHNSRTVFSF
jgi:hypothetical protein